MKVRTLTYLISILCSFSISVTFAQKQDSVKRNTFKIGKCRAVVAGMAGGRVSKRVLINAGKVDIQFCDSCRIDSFDFSIDYSTLESYALIKNAVVEKAKRAKSALFTNEMIGYIRKAPRGATVSIYQITYSTKTGDTLVLKKDLSFTVE
jgi:hypothetical protein